MIPCKSCIPTGIKGFNASKAPPIPATSPPRSKILEPLPSLPLLKIDEISCKTGRAGRAPLYSCLWNSLMPLGMLTFFGHALAGQVPAESHALADQALACHALQVQVPVDQGLPSPPQDHAHADQAPPSLAPA